MILYCDSSECVNCRRNTCQLGTLTLFSGECQEYEDVTKGPDYQEEYFIACRFRPEVDAEAFRYREKKKGKRVELRGVTFYTQEDIREGIGGARFTEAHTGFRVKGEDILDDERFKKVMKAVRTDLPVLMLPWMDSHGDLPPTPHVEV